MDDIDANSYGRVLELGISKYILDENNNTVREPDIITWGLWIAENKERKKVGYTELPHIHISTVFLGTDHGFGNVPPILFETCLFYQPGSNANVVERYATWEQAVKGHNRWVKRSTPGPYIPDEDDELE